MRATKGVVAKVVNFDWPVGYPVLAYSGSYRASDGTILKNNISGAVYDARTREIIDKRIRRGETLFIDEIYAKGPDDEKRSINPIAFLVN